MMNAVLAGMIGMPQVWIILVVVLVLFGGRKIPELMKGLGKGVKEFKDASKAEEVVNEDNSEENEKIETK